MGFNTSGQNRRFATISDGKIVVNHLNPIEGVTEQRLNKNGKLVHEQKFSSYTGRITSVSSKETSFGKVWELTMKDGDEEVVISWNYSSRYTNNFFRALPNVDFSKEVTVNPWSMKDKNDATKKVIGLSMLQDGKKVPYKWDRENPGDMPDLKKIKVKGKEEWDDSDQLLFFENYLKNLDLRPQEELPF